jgi:BCD family chlorophyll transporter-like MFS transporter
MLRKQIQIGLIHGALAMSLVPINATLNRVMIKDLELSATLVALLASLPYLFSPIQVAIGSFSDRHPVWGLRRTPYILLGLLLCVFGLVSSPYAAFLMPQNILAGLLVSIIAFGAWGMGFNFATVAYFSLATEISGEKGRSRTIAVMFIMMILIIIMTSIGLYRLLDPYSEAILIRAFWMIGSLALVMGVLGLLGVENRNQNYADLAKEERYPWSELIRKTRENSQVVLFFWYLILMLAAILGQDVLLEPFAAEAFDLPVNVTSRITSIWGGAFLISMAIAAVLDRKISKRSQAVLGAWGGIISFVLITASGIWGNLSIFYIGVISLGIATGLATVSNLSLMLDMTLPGTEGLYIGIWGMANAFSRLVGNVMSGAVRDASSDLFNNLIGGYVVVFLLQAVMLAVSLLLLRRVDVSAFQKRAAAITLAERVALASEA